MIYVMEFGPLEVAGKGKQWLVFSMELDPRALRVLFMHLAYDQATARRAMSMQLSVQGENEVQCCESLARFGQGRGWQVAKPTLAVWRRAALIFASLDLREELGGCDFSPELDVLLQSAALFVLGKPWEQPFAQPSHLLPSGEVAGVFGNAGVPALALLPDQAAFERAQSKDPRLSALPDVLLVAASPSESAFTKQAYGVGFRLTILRRRAGRAVPVTFGDLERAASAMRLFALGEAKYSNHAPSPP